MEEKRCPMCGLSKPKSEFNRNAANPHGTSTYCRPCHHLYNRRPDQVEKKKRYNKENYAKNADRERERALDRYRKDPEPIRARQRKANNTPEEWRKKLEYVASRARKCKSQVFGHYGTRCACCGESNMGFLTIDHIDGCDKETRKRQGLGSTFYSWLRHNRFPQGFQTLCYNCNMGRARNGGICPHVLLSS
jgi:hypothetical protein